MNDFGIPRIELSQQAHTELLVRVNRYYDSSADAPSKELLVDLLTNGIATQPQIRTQQDNRFESLWRDIGADTRNDCVFEGSYHFVHIRRTRECIDVYYYINYRFAIRICVIGDNAFDTRGIVFCSRFV